MNIASFRRAVWKYYKAHGRDLPWRKTRNPYNILVSEIMLQQTQVERVIPKYRTFLKRFPDFKTLARAPLRNVLSEWQGLGYNRRAVSLHRLATIVIREHKGVLPCETDKLIALPGVGTYTANAVRAFSWNLPGICLETNVRTAFIHAFFPRTKKVDPVRGKIPKVSAAPRERASNGVDDKRIEAQVVKTLDIKNPREWYWALMDYGAMIKREHGNFSRQSQHYTKQTRFEGSFRQVRSTVLKTVLEKPVKLPELVRKVKKDKVLIEKALRALLREGAIKMENGIIAI
ncbi:MAG: A/G-specific adenine glycosylase [bacterium]|nr:A/G-specific adenine glycosylase [bacterium]